MKTIINDEGDEVNLPTVMVVCYACQGRGKTTLRGISFTSEEMYEDPDFAEDYFSGAYDTTCEDCLGRNVVEEVDEDALSPALLTLWRSWEREMHDSYMISKMERMMGA